MNMIEIIKKKRNGGELSSDEIRYFIQGYSSERIADYQASAFLMALWFSGMNDRETSDFTLAMAESGDMIDLSDIPGIKVDKHSTGGVADTTTLIVAPIVAACGGKVAKMSGRGLGHTGGTLDKLESIPGFSVQQDMRRFIEIVSRYGLSVIGQTKDLVPADKKLYALRDVTATIDSIPLIASSIMSKKLAAGSDAIVLDVKTGSGAFMKESGDAVKLAELMVRIGNSANRKTVAIVSDMSQPLGVAIGNALEVKEAIEVLRGERAGDLFTVSRTLAAKMLVLSKLFRNDTEAFRMIDEVVANGKALDRLAAMIEAQGGNSSVIKNTDLLPAARAVIPVRASKSGFIGSIDAEEIGMACLLLGAGRTDKDESIDPAVGIWMEKRLGESVVENEVLGWFHVNDSTRMDEALERYINAIRITIDRQPVPELIYAEVV